MLHLSVIRWLRPYRSYFIVTIDVFLIVVSLSLSFLIRFQFEIPPEYLDRYLFSIPFFVLVRVPVFVWFGLHTGLWKYISIPDLFVILKAVTLGTVLLLAGIVFIHGHGYPRAILIVDWILCIGFLVGVRVTYRTFRESAWSFQSTNKKTAIIIGAGDMGEMLLRSISVGNSENYNIVGFVDEDIQRHGTRIRGVEILGSIEDLKPLCKKKDVDELLIALPDFDQDKRRSYFKKCWETGLPFKSIPSVESMLDGSARISQLQSIEPEDILGREGIDLDIENFQKEFQGKRLLVTGAAGSIGSELCRQLGKFGPEILVLFERAESNLFFLEQDLRNNYPNLQIVSFIGDIQDQRNVDEVIRKFTPDVIYHVAAYKHVPLMEAYPIEAVMNNIFGAEIIGRTAVKEQVNKVVFISTDKAVNPVGIMGMTKRISECLLRTLNRKSTSFVVVRFGNVMGSEGSVMPLFKWQINKGGPVTITDEAASRFFMLISEAAKLIIQAGAIGKGGEIFFLDMGEPVRIVDFARKLIKFSGFVPGREIPIKISGLRPGERVNETLVKADENLLKTGTAGIFEVQSHPFDHEEFWEDVEELRRIVEVREKNNVILKVKELAKKY